ncbi:MAG: ammonium transporter [Planctomyces sp.]|nr:ammonium transporter [Planctomyces sp.]
MPVGAITSVVLAQADEGSAPAEAPGVVEATVEETEVAVIPGDLDLTYAIDNLLLFLCAVLVIFMQAGFSLVEAGLNSSKNTVNILFKNAMDFCLGVLIFYFLGYALMYPQGSGHEGGYFGFGPKNFEEVSAPTEGGTLNPQVDFLFQAAFCATAATIVSGAVAGRMKFAGYLIYTAIITGFVYPVSGYWKWGLGWLDAMGFHDFAGSIVVHAVGGFAGLAGAIALGPRIGRFTSEGKPVPWPGHNLPFVSLGVFILLIGWYGFNPGSQLAFAGTENTDAVMLIALNTTLAACAGGAVGMALSWLLFRKPDLTLALNGILAGLVGITANCDCVTNVESVIIGAVAGAVCIGAVMLLDKLKIDDPVGAFPVHGACGLWGGIATGIFGAEKDLKVQLIGSAAIIAWAFITMAIVFFTLKAIGLLRVPPEEEIEGLDMVEHGMSAYGTDPK